MLHGQLGLWLSAADQNSNQQATPMLVDFVFIS
jgi:hypothetical protein